MEEIFDLYVSQFDLTDKDIKLKKDHSHKVSQLSCKVAQKLGFSERDIYLAKFIGLFHDIGRFYQLEGFHTYDDKKSIDHAEYGVEVLFDKMIDKFSFTNEEKEIIKNAIYYHNKYEVPHFEDKKMEDHVKLIRDIDKIDILRVIVDFKTEDLDEDNAPISKLVYEDFKNEKPVDRSNCVSKTDEVVSMFSFIFDINFSECIVPFCDNAITFYKQLKKKDKYKEMIDKIKEKRNMYARYEV